MDSYSILIFNLAVLWHKTLSLSSSFLKKCEILKVPKHGIDRHFYVNICEFISEFQVVVSSLG